MSRSVARCAALLTVLPALLLAASHARAQGFGGTVADHLVRGDSLLAQKKATEAIVQFQEARTLCPTPDEIVSALEGEARGHLLLKEMLPAVGLLDEAATRFPDDPRAANLLYQAGAVSQGAGEFDKAIDFFHRSLERHPTADILPALKLQLAQALRMRGRPAEAVEVLKDFEKDFPDNALVPTVLYYQAMATHDAGTGSGERARLEEAAAIYTRLIGKYPGQPAAIEAHFEMGLVLSELGRKAEGADYFQKYASLNPTSPETPIALERAADLLLLRAPSRSAELYALAQLKAGTNPKPSSAVWSLSRWLPVKRRVADALSRTWVLVVLGLVILGAVALLARLLVKRLRKTPVPAGA